MATDQNLEVLISANAEGVKTGMVDAEKAVKSSSANMAQALKEVEAHSSSAAAAMEGSFKQMSVAAKSHLGSIGNVFEGLKSNLLGFAAVLGGGALFAEGVRASKEMTGESIKLSKALGVPVEQASELNVALKSVGLSADAYAGANQRLTRMLKSNESGLQAMGVQTRDASGELLNGEKIMTSAVESLGKYKEGTDRNLAAQALFGRGAAEATALLKLNAEAMENARVKAEELGLVVGQKQAGEMKAYKEAMEGVGLVIDGIQNQIGKALIPILTELAEMFSSTGPARVKIMAVVMENLADIFRVVIRGAMELKDTVMSAFSRIGDAISGGTGQGVTGLQVLKNVMSILKVAVLALELGITIAFELITGTIELAVSYIMRFANIASAAMRMDWSGVKSAWAAGVADVERIFNASGERIVKKSVEIAAQMQAALMGENLTENKEGEKKASGPKGTKSFTAEDKGSGKDEGMMRALELELAQKKVAYQEQQRLEGSFREFSKQSELEYWQSKLAVVAAGSKDEVAIKLKIAHEKLAIDKASFTAQIASIHASGEEFKKNADVQLQVAQQVADTMKKAYGEDSKEFIDAQRAKVAAQRAADQQRQDIEQQHRAVVKSQGLAEIEDARAVMQLKLSVGMITVAQSLELERQYAERKLAIERGSLMAELAMVDPKKDPVQVAKLNAQLEELEIKHQTVIRGIEVKTQAESLKYYAAIGQGMQTSLESSFKGILTHTMTVGGAIRNMFTSMGSTLASVASKMAADWVMNQIKMRLASKETALAQLNNNAMAAAGAAYNAVVGIPYVGPFLAPAAAAVAYAGVMAFGSLASAEGGYDIPAGTNPVTQLHQNEMVLPVKYADVIRGMADKAPDRGESGSSRGDSGGPLTVHNHVTISTPMDSRTRDQLLADMANATHRAVVRNR